MSSEETIFQADGSLLLRIKRDRATWFSVLAASRVPNSLQGGWNFQSLWKQHGLVRMKELSCRGAVEEWTRNSLKSGEDPPVRRANFRFNPEMSETRKSRKSSLSENALSTLLYLAYSGRGDIDALYQDDVRFVGYEVPLVEERRGMLRIDLLGVTRTADIAIVELKRRNSHDSPLMAFVEAVCYAIQFLRCGEPLLAELRSATGVALLLDRSEHVHVRIAAPEPYWASWTDDHTGMAFRDDISDVLGPVNKVLEEKGHARVKLEIDALPVKRLQELEVAVNAPSR
jgi:hypothetical protein